MLDGNLFLLFAGLALLSYFLGCFNGAVIVSKYILRDDIRNHGSGNAGLTNFYRTFGGKLTFAVIAMDVIKMLIAVWVSVGICSVFAAEVPVFVRYFSGVFCMFGHMFPCMFHFRGGKGILSGGTLTFLLDWRIAAIVWGLFLLAVILTRMISLGSCLAGVSFPLASIWVYQSMGISIIALVIGFLILWQHRANIQRILKGEESKFHFRRKKVKP